MPALAPDPEIPTSVLTGRPWPDHLGTQLAQQGGDLGADGDDRQCEHADTRERPLRGVGRRTRRTRPCLRPIAVVLPGRGRRLPAGRVSVRRREPRLFGDVRRQDDGQPALRRLRPTPP